MKSIKPESERYRRVQEDSSGEQFQSDDAENNVNIVVPSWRRSILETNASFHRVATMDEEYDHMETAAETVATPHDASFTMTSFDLDDEDAELGRYNLDFTEGTVERIRTQLSAGSTLDERMEEGRLSLSILWEVFCKARVETKRKRMERMLSLNSDLERFSLTVSSYCDLTDRGMPVLILILMAFNAMAFILLENPWKWIMVGALMFSVRVFWRAAYWYLWGRQLAKKRKRTLEKYAETNSLALEMVPDFALKKEFDTSMPPSIHEKVFNMANTSSSEEDDDEEEKHERVL